MGIYNVYGQNQESVSDIYISKIKELYPSYNDDQLFDTAIALAKANGATSIIVWDGSDIHFSGSVEHVCDGFGGIDFAGSAIYMPNVDNKVLLTINPDTTEDITASASDFNEFYTTDTRLKNKIFKVTGNEDMSLGHRYSDQSENIIYASQVLFVNDDGYYKTGKLYLAPQTGDVPCYNVHDYPSVTFDISNGTIITPNTQNMSTLISCNRSNTHLHNFVLLGRSDIRQYHNGIFVIGGCVDIEIDHISGINPIMKSKTSGYFLGLFSVSFAHVHDVYVGDGDSWGSVGSNFLTNTVFERCHLNRWDCHYAQYGLNAIKNCVLQRISYGGAGYGQFVVENCLLNSFAEKTVIFERPDISTVFDGNIIVKDSVIAYRNSGTGISLWADKLDYAKDSVCKASDSPKGYRIITNCRLEGVFETVFQVGTKASDYNQNENINYVIECTDIPSVDTIISAYSPSNQKCKKIIVSKCNIETGQTVTDITHITQVID